MGKQVRKKNEGSKMYMKETCLKRLLSFALVIAMVVSLCPTMVFAGDTLPDRGESAMGQN